MLEAGLTLGNNNDKRWQVIRKIGSGRCCEVYEGLDIVSKSQVAIKVYNEGLKFNCAQQKEVLLLKIIREKYGVVQQLVEMIGNCCYGKQKVLIEEYLEPSLPVIIYTAKQQGHLSLYIIYKILSDVTRGLSVLHQCGFVHADVKPDNVMWSLTLSGFKVIDFGLTFNIQDKDIGLVQSSSYRAPEVNRSPGQTSYSVLPNTAIDVWSLGVLILYLVTEEKFTNFQKRSEPCLSCQNDEERCDNEDIIEKLFKQTIWHVDSPCLNLLKNITKQCLQCKCERRPSTVDILQQMSLIPKTNASFMDLLILPSNIICLLNIVTSDELTDEVEIKDMKEDIVEECSKYGRIIDCILPTDGAAVGKVFVCFSTHSEAATAFSKLNGRSFNGKTVITTYFLADDFYQNNLF